MTDDRFSQRYGHRPNESDIKIRDDAPEEIREALLAIAEGEIGLGPSKLRSVLCTVLRKLPDSSNWSEYPNVWDECQYLLLNAPWYKVYDFVEALHRDLTDSYPPEKAGQWTKLVNEQFAELGVGWKMVDGLLETRGTEAFEIAVKASRQNLKGVEFSTAEIEIHEALSDLSRRPTPDLTGAIQHAMAALECTAREVAGDPRATLGEILKRHEQMIPKPLDQALSKLWGFTSETGRHLREGRSPSRAEVELVVGLSATVCTYLTTKVNGIVQ